MKTEEQVRMHARSLLRQARCPECGKRGMDDSEDCAWCDERNELTATYLLADSVHETAADPLAELMQEAIQCMGTWEYDDLRNWRQRAEAALSDRATPVRASTAEVVLPNTAESTASPVQPESICPYCHRVNGGHSLACSAQKTNDESHGRPRHARPAVLRDPWRVLPGRDHGLTRCAAAAAT